MLENKRGFSVAIDPADTKQLDRIAQSLGVSRAAVIRMAVKAFLKAQEEGKEK